MIRKHSAKGAQSIEKCKVCLGTIGGLKISFAIMGHADFTCLLHGRRMASTTMRGILVLMIDALVQSKLVSDSARELGT